MGANGRFAISPMRRGFVFCGAALLGQDAAAAINAKKLRRRIAFPRPGLIEKKELEPDQLQHSPVASLGEMLFLKKIPSIDTDGLHQIVCGGFARSR
jgi:hypothetical protein